MVHFSDESKFNLFGSGGKRFVRCKNREFLHPQYDYNADKLGGESVMVWGMISSVEGKRSVCFHGNIIVSVYKEHLRELSLLHLRKETVGTPIFMKDNAPFYEAFLEEERIAIIKWPPQRPYMISLEIVWKIWGEKLRKEIPILLLNLGVFWKKNWKVSLPTFVRS